MNQEDWDRNTPSNSPKALVTIKKKRKNGKERVHREKLSKSVHFTSVDLARQNSKKDHMRRPEKIFTSSRIRTKLRFSSNRSKGNAGAYFEKTRREKIRSRFKSIIAQDEQKRMKLRRLRHFAKVRELTVVLTANGEVHANEESQVYVHDLNLFVTLQLLEETPAVISLGILWRPRIFL